jgi:hypothetical protein
MIRFATVAVMGSARSLTPSLRSAASYAAVLEDRAVFLEESNWHEQPLSALNGFQPSRDFRIKQVQLWMLTATFVKRSAYARSVSLLALDRAFEDGPAVTQYY